MRLVSLVKSLFDVDTIFSVSMGEICKICHSELDENKGGFTGRSAKCEKCKTKNKRETNLKKLGI